MLGEDKVDIFLQVFQCDFSFDWADIYLGSRLHR